MTTRVTDACYRALRVYSGYPGSIRAWLLDVYVCVFLRHTHDRCEHDRRVIER